MAETKPTKRESISIYDLWVSALMWVSSVFFQGFHKDLGFFIAGGVGVIISVIMFIKGSLVKKILWLSVAMFAASVLFQGFHSDLGFTIAGIVGFIALTFLFYAARKRIFIDIKKES